MGKIIDISSAQNVGKQDNEHMSLMLKPFVVDGKVRALVAINCPLYVAGKFDDSECEDCDIDCIVNVFSDGTCQGESFAYYMGFRENEDEDYADDDDCRDCNLCNELMDELGIEFVDDEDEEYDGN